MFCEERPSHLANASACDWKGDLDPGEIVRKESYGNTKESGTVLEDVFEERGLHSAEGRQGRPMTMGYFDREWSPLRLTFCCVRLGQSLTGI